MLDQLEFPNSVMQKITFGVTSTYTEKLINLANKTVQ